MSRAPFVDLIAAILVWVAAVPAGAMQIVCSTPADPQQDLAAREVRRYFYLRTGEIPEISSTLSGKDGAIVIARKVQELAKQFVAEADLNALAPDCYLLRRADENTLLIIGGDSLSTLHGAYRFCELLGVRFYLHGDVVPDERILASLPEVHETGKPRFELRGTVPFHDFPMGPDWWNVDDYKGYISQLAKMRMNFVGFHTYPENRHRAEPTVWLGLKEDILAGGRVKHSYPSCFDTTRRNDWGYLAVDTSDWVFGSASIFERDDFGANIMRGFTPLPDSDKDCNLLFERMAVMLKDTFAFAGRVGVKTCVGTEIPLRLPEALREHLENTGRDPDDPAVLEEIYDGLFSRIKASYPIDYYWLWTDEGWKKEDPERLVEEVRIAHRSAAKAGLDCRLATCGWTLGAEPVRKLFEEQLPEDVAMSAINPRYGRLPVDEAFAEIKDREKWAIPWFESDSPAIGYPELRVGMMIRDADRASAFGCNGLMGLHWKTRGIDQNASALAWLGWEEKVDVAEVYRDYCATSFGPEAADDIAEILLSVDGCLPKTGPTTCCRFPGFSPSGHPWEEEKENFAFVDRLAELRPRIKGRGSLMRFDYWLNQFGHMKETAHASCTWHQYNAVIDRIASVAKKDPAEARSLTEKEALPLQDRMLEHTRRIYQMYLASVSTPGDLGTISLWNRRWLPGVLALLDRDLEAALRGETAPAPVDFSGYQSWYYWPETSKELQARLKAYKEKVKGKLDYNGPTRVIVPTARTLLEQDEDLVIKVMILRQGDVSYKSVLKWRPLGKGEFQTLPLEHVARSVFKGTLNAELLGGRDFEYFVETRAGDGEVLRWPATAPEINQTVVVLAGE
jgi:hypothetical protein